MWLLRALVLLALLAQSAWAAAPTFIQHAEGVNWTSNTSPKTATVTVQTGDIIVVGGATENNGTTLNTPTNDGAALTWTLRQNAVGVNNTQVYGWTTTADSNRTIVVSITVGGAGNWGMYARVWRGSDGVGASNKVEGDTTANFSVDLTTTQANSAIDVISDDFAAVAGARTYLTGAGTFTEKTAVDGTQHAVRTGYHADAGAIATYTVGVSAPAGQDLSIVVIEIKGTAGAGSAPQRSLTGVGT